jgi:hypothetical protein
MRCPPEFERSPAQPPARWDKWGIESEKEWQFCFCFFLLNGIFVGNSRNS